MIPFSEERLARLADMERRHFWFRGRQAMVERLWQRHVKGPCRVLDVGCGTGHMAQWLSIRGHSVAGLDARPEGLRAMRRARPEADLVQAEAAHLPLADASFDVVLMLDVLEHVDDAASLKQVHRVLRPGGWVILSVPALPWLWSYRDLAAGHRRRYTRRQLQQRLIGACFDVRDMRFYQFLLMPLAMATRLAGRRGPRLRDLEERPPRLFNRIMTGANRLEARLSDWIAWPAGTSLLAACRKS